MTVELSVVVSCFNEERTIAKVLDAVRESGIESLELIVVDDASTDGSAALLQGPLRDKLDVFERHPVNRGKGAALRTGSGPSSFLFSLREKSLPRT